MRKTGAHLIWSLVLNAVFLPAVVYASQSLDERLNLPARHYSSAAKSLFVDIKKAGQRLIAAGERGLIVYSDDNGGVWTQAAVPVSNSLTSLFFIDDKTGWAVGHGGVILRTLNGGASWEKQFDGYQANQIILEQISKKVVDLKATYDSADELTQEDLLYEIEDAEFALSDAEYDAEVGPANPFLDVWFKNENEGYVVGAYGLFFTTDNGGNTWEFAAGRLENFDRYHLNSLEEIVGGALLIAGEAGALFVSYDQGAQWETLFSPYQGSFFGIQPTKNKDEVLVYGLRGNVFKSSDNGQSWQQVTSPVTTTFTGSFMAAEGKLTLVGFSGTVVTSDDDGESFTVQERNGFEAYNAVASLDDNSLAIASEHGIQYINKKHVNTNN